MNNQLAKRVKFHSRKISENTYMELNEINMYTGINLIHVTGINFSLVVCPILYVSRYNPSTLARLA